MYDKEYYEGNRERLLKNQKRWQQKNTEHIKNYQKNYIQSNPWAKHLRYIATRCRPKGIYYKKGIRSFITTKDIKKLWFRGEAWKLSRPSIDRLNPLDNYYFENCRFIELRENQLAGITNRWKKYREAK